MELLSQEERLVRLTEYLREHHRIKVQTICQLFHVSRDTARRDVVKLVASGNAIRTHGGLMLPRLTKDVLGYNERLARESTGKREIGRAAASYVKNGDHVIFDASTTVQFTAQYLVAQDITVVTNAIDAAGILADKDGVTVHLLGGILNGRHRFLFGSSTINKLAEYHVDKLFLGVPGISADGISYPLEEDGEVKKEMIRHADQVIVLADSTKFGKRLFHRVAGFESIDMIITDREPDMEISRILRDYGVQIIVAKGECRDD